MAVFKNYYLGGAEWSNVKSKTFKTMPFDKNLAGSVNLANATLESYTQADAPAKPIGFFKPGCFSCHGGAKIGKTAFASYLITAKKGAAPGKMDRCNAKAGPIFNQAQANVKCPAVCKTGQGWNGNWLTIKGTLMSVCGCNACPTQP